MSKFVEYLNSKPDEKTLIHPRDVKIDTPMKLYKITVIEEKGIKRDYYTEMTDSWKLVDLNYVRRNVWRKQFMRVTITNGKQELTLSMVDHPETSILNRIWDDDNSKDEYLVLFTK